MSIESPLVTGADQFEQHAGLRLILGDIGEIVENQQVIFVEFGVALARSASITNNPDGPHEIDGTASGNAAHSRLITVLSIVLPTCGGGKACFSTNLARSAAV
jgi:hypothetical protein